MLAQFAHAERGTVGVLFALIAIPLTAIAGWGLDYGRATWIRGSLQASADTAAAAGLQLVGRPTEHISNSVRSTLDANLPADYKAMPYDLQVAADGSTVTVKLEVRVRTPLLAVAGIASLPVTVTGYARRQVRKMPELPRDAERQIDRLTRGRGIDALPGAAATASPEAQRKAADAMADLARALGGSGRGDASSLPQPTAADFDRLRAILRR
jgi:Flp pilus assembly protein TadG